MIEKQKQVCPYLGLSDDPESAISYPSKWNRCFHVRPAGPVNLEFQSSHCLSPNHPICEVYARNLAALPRSIQGKQISVLPRKWLLIGAGLALGLLVLMVLLAWLRPAFGSGGLFGGGSSARQTASAVPVGQGEATAGPADSPIPPTFTRTASSTPTEIEPILFYFTATLTPTPTPTLTPTPTNTPLRTVIALPTDTRSPDSPSKPTHTRVPPTTVPPTSVPATNTKAPTAIQPTNTRVPPTAVPPTTVPTQAPTENQP